LKPVSNDDLEEVRQAKCDLWRRFGWLTHSDAAMWASKILGHSRFGLIIAAEVTRRFPLIVVDEAQDTGYFLRNAILSLLNSPSVRGLVVGDPDQAIYEFNGAKPDLFNAFESIDGAHALPLARSLRCPPAVAKASSYLKDSGGEIEPETENAGKAILIRGRDMNAEVAQITAAVIESRPTACVKVLARRNTTVDLLTGRPVKELPKLRCPSLTHMTQAVQAFRRGRQAAALANARAALELVLFGHEGASDQEIRERGIDPDEWKRFVVRCFLLINNLPTPGNLYDWQTSVGVKLDEKLSRYCQDNSIQFQEGKLKPKKSKKDKSWSRPFNDFVPRLESANQLKKNTPANTVHAVKGETHDVTIFVCPDEGKEGRSPSQAWWSAKEEDREERRIAYVAMTRTRGDLIIWMGSESFDSLVADRPAFVGCFEHFGVEEAISTLSNGA
jgi:DNA helicase-2/ATP-dependent DNA helicase PcrA